MTRDYSIVADVQRDTCFELENGGFLTISKEGNEKKEFPTLESAKDYVSSHGGPAAFFTLIGLSKKALTKVKALTENEASQKSAAENRSKAFCPLAQSGLLAKDRVNTVCSIWQAGDSFHVDRASTWNVYSALSLDVPEETRQSLAQTFDTICSGKKMEVVRIIEPLWRIDEEGPEAILKSYETFGGNDEAIENTQSLGRAYLRMVPAVFLCSLDPEPSVRITSSINGLGPRAENEEAYKNLETVFTKMLPSFTQFFSSAKAFEEAQPLKVAVEVTAVNGEGKKKASIFQKPSIFDPVLCTGVYVVESTDDTDIDHWNFVQSSYVDERAHEQLDGFEWKNVADYLYESGCTFPASYHRIAFSDIEEERHPKPFSFPAFSLPVRNTVTFDGLKLTHLGIQSDEDDEVKLWAVHSAASVDKELQVKSKQNSCVVFDSELVKSATVNSSHRVVISFHVMKGDEAKLNQAHVDEVKKDTNESLKELGVDVDQVAGRKQQHEVDLQNGLYDGFWVGQCEAQSYDTLNFFQFPKMFNLDDMSIESEADHLHTLPIRQFFN